jgi:hypothetical protein
LLARENKVIAFWDIASCSLVEVDRHHNSLTTEAVQTCETSVYRHPSLSAVNWFQKNRAPSEKTLELHRKVSVQKLKSAK